MKRPPGGTSREWELSRSPAVTATHHYTHLCFSLTAPRRSPGPAGAKCHPCLPLPPYYIGWWHGMAHERVEMMAAGGVPLAHEGTTNWPGWRHAPPSEVRQAQLARGQSSHATYWS